jgi:hypothetical protein
MEQRAREFAIATAANTAAQLSSLGSEAPLRQAHQADGLARKPQHEHVGWVGQGEAFGASALLTSRTLRPASASVVAGDSGVQLAVLDRAVYARLQNMACMQVHPGGSARATLDGLLAAACTPLLAVPPARRRTLELDALADLMGSMRVRCLIV